FCRLFSKDSVAIDIVASAIAHLPFLKYVLTTLILSLNSFNYAFFWIVFLISLYATCSNFYFLARLLAV
ncbi:hypothetical protein L9F63_013005, partial [Diploptera punctata]